MQSLEGGVQSCSTEFIESSTDSSDSGDLFVAHVLEDLDDDLRGELHQGDGSAGGVGGGASHIVACFHQTLGVSLTISLLGAGCSCVWPHLYYALSAQHCPTIHRGLHLIKVWKRTILSMQSFTIDHKLWKLDLQYYLKTEAILGNYVTVTN